VKINGELHYPWRAVDHEGEVLESFVTKRRDMKEAMKFLKKTMRRHGPADEIVTDLLRSYCAALKEIGAESLQETVHRANSRAENSNQPVRRRERAMLRFRRVRTLRKFRNAAFPPDRISRPPAGHGRCWRREKLTRPHRPTEQSRS